MGQINQFHFLSRSLDRAGIKRVIEIGSKQYGSTIPWRKFFPGVDYVGIDMQEGEGVDLVLDIAQPDAALPEPADLLICCSVLEHVKRPWIAADSIERMVRPGGFVYVAVPWVWRYHPYPDDYWRFSFNGIRELFQAVDWQSQGYSTSKEGEFVPAVEGADNGMAVMSDERKFLPYLELHSLGVRR